MDMDGQLQQISLTTHTSWISTSDCKLTEDTAFLSWYIIKKKTNLPRAELAIIAATAIQSENNTSK